MAESAHNEQLGKFVVLFQTLEKSLVEIIDVIAGADYVVEILPAETEYRRLVESTSAIFSQFVDLLREPDVGARKRFHILMERCLDIGVLRNRLIHSTYAHLERAGHVVTLEQAQAKLKFKGASRREAIGDDLPAESFEPYFQQITSVLAELESFRLQVIEWKHPGAHRAPH